jgi:nucleoid-associated protein YgaU
MNRTDVRRRRATLVAVALGISVLVTGPARAALGPDAPDAGRRYVVRSGDTVWSIAERQDEDSDPRPLVDEIQRSNHLSDGSIVPGQRLWIPSAG